MLTPVKHVCVLLFQKKTQLLPVCQVKLSLWQPEVLDNWEIGKVCIFSGKSLLYLGLFK